MATGDSIGGAKLAELREPPTDPVYAMDPEIETEIVFDPEAAAKYLSTVGAVVNILAKEGVQCREVTLNPSDGTVHFRFDFDHNKLS